MAVIEIRAKYERALGSNYECPDHWAGRLAARFKELCERYRLESRMPAYPPEAPDLHTPQETQLALF